MYQPLLTELSRYSDGLSTARDLETWLVSELQNVLDTGDQEAIGLANEVDGILVELSEALTSEPESLASIQALVRMAETRTVEYAEFARAVRDEATSSEAETITHRVVDRPVEDVRLQASFA